MGRFLNSKMSYGDYCETASEPFFSDQSESIQERIPTTGKKDPYFCITRPRRFGKSAMANRTCNTHRV